MAQGYVTKADSLIRISSTESATRFQLSDVQPRYWDNWLFTRDIYLKKPQRNWFSLPKILYFLRTSTCIIDETLLEQYYKTVKRSVRRIFWQHSECSTDSDSLMGSKEVIRIVISTSCLFGFSFRGNFWTFLVHKSTSDMVGCYQWTGESYRWEPEKLDHPFAAYCSECDIRTKMTKKFNAQQGKFRLQWLNVVHCKNVELTIDDQKLKNCFGLLVLGANIRVAQNATVVK